MIFEPRGDFLVFFWRSKNWWKIKVGWLSWGAYCPGRGPTETRPPCTRICNHYWKWLKILGNFLKVWKDIWIPRRVVHNLREKWTTCKKWKGCMLGCFVICLTLWLLDAICFRFVAVDFLFCLGRPFRRPVKNDDRMLPVFVLGRLVPVSVFCCTLPTKAFGSRNQKQDGII